MGGLTLSDVRINRGKKWHYGECSGLVFIFPREGSGIVISTTVNQKITAGDVIIVNNASHGCVSTDSKNDIFINTFSVCLEHMFPLLLSSEIALAHQLTENPRTFRYFGATDSLARESNEIIRNIAPTSALKHRGQLLSIVANYLSFEIENTRTHHQNYPPLEDNLIQVFERLSVEELLGLSVEELAVKCNCSRRHLNRLFHEHFKFSVGALKMEIRLLKALSLLRDPAAKISSVARECGFNHPGLFATCFKRRFGSSPAQWRTEMGSIYKKEPPTEEKTQTCQRLNSGFCPLSTPSSCHTGPNPTINNQANDTPPSLKLPSVQPQFIPESTVPPFNGNNERMRPE